jgi:hypothetical protein
MSAILGVENMLNLAGGKWKPIARVSPVIPYGYKVDENDAKVLIPIIKELETLELAKLYLKRKFSMRSVADWMSAESGKKISANGLRLRVEMDNRRYKKIASLKLWARKIENAYKEALALEERLGRDTQDTEESLREFRKLLRKE